MPTRRNMKSTRTLAALMYADVKGFTHLMAASDKDTTELLIYYKDIIANLVRKYEGRVADRPGDCVLSEFQSVVRATECAVDIQCRISAENHSIPPANHMWFRIGIHFGDILRYKGKVYGDGVNLAARIEAFADPGGIALSEAAYEEVKNKLKVRFNFKGKKNAKNIEQPIRIYSVDTRDIAGTVSEDKAAPRAKQRSELPSNGRAEGWIPVKEFSELLTVAKNNESLPTVDVFNRIDGPGSSLDLREFQQAYWRIPKIPSDLSEDPSMSWSQFLPRTVGITIDKGTRIEAHPLKPGFIGIQSIEYETEVIEELGDVPPGKEYWLLKVLDLFNLSGVKFVLTNHHAGTHSAGLGGSATAAAGVCLLANELAERPFEPMQLIAMASRLEQDMGVSLTGTQEQSNVFYGGVTDYLWFPWGVPGHRGTGYGHSVRTQLVSPDNYDELGARMAIYHTGIMHQSWVVNAVWLDRLKTLDGFRIHRRKLQLAYEYRESLRKSDWDGVLHAIREYRAIRTELCPEYMKEAHIILGRAEAKDATAFPLGSGGGGGVLIFAKDPDQLGAIREDLKATSYKEISFRILPVGHRLKNLPLEK